MFFCEICRRKYTWPESQERHRTTCEMCGTKTTCFLVPDEQLSKAPFIEDPESHSSENGIDLRKVIEVPIRLSEQEITAAALQSNILHRITLARRLAWSVADENLNQIQEYFPTSLAGFCDTMGELICQLTSLRDRAAARMPELTPA